MATTMQKSLAEYKDIVLRKIFLVSLVDSNDVRVVYLEQTAAEILSKGKPLLLSRDLLERVLVDRLSVSSEPPFLYLVSCYRRAYEEGRKMGSMKDKIIKSELETLVRQAKSLSVSYCRIHLSNPDMFSSSEKGKIDGNVSPLLPLILSEVSSSMDVFGGSAGSGSGIVSPPGFIEEIFRDSDLESLEPILRGLYEDLRGSVLRVSAIGNFQPSLRALSMLVSFPNCAKALVNHQWWVPKGAYVNGRVMEITSILGAFFHISAIPDHTAFMSKPDVGQECFAEASTRTSADLHSSFITIKNVRNNLNDGLKRVLLSLLKNTETKESVLHFLAEVITKNSSRAHMQINPITCASSGMFVNLSDVMLRLCEPFLDARLTKKGLIDPTYVLYNTRLDLKELTALHASSDEVKAWIDNDTSESKANSTMSSSEKSKYTFTCECFFMTARVLNLGLLKAISDFKRLSQNLLKLEDTMSMYRDMKAQSPSPQLELDIASLEKEIESHSQEKFCYEAQILRDEVFLQGAMAFYRLMVVRLVDCVGGFIMPLPATCPMIFASMPEHFVEDTLELLIFASRVPKAFDGFKLDEFMNFIILFMASSEFIRNPYIRAKMVEVLICWMPNRSKPAATASVFELNSLSLQYLVRILLKLYVDIEFTGSHSQFYDKFNIRHNIVELLEYLWSVPNHRDAWKRIAKEEEKRLYLNVLNFLINDSTYLLDESLSKILEIKELEAEMLNAAEWEKKTAEEKQERTSHFHSLENIIRSDMKLANEDVGMLVFTSEEITTPFLLAEMVERVANMLNYFLLQLVGPQRKCLRLKDPEKYEFQPKLLLKQIVKIYVHLSRGDKENIFPTAISKDDRSYNGDLFTAAANILGKIGEDGRLIREFVELGDKAKVLTSEALDIEAALGEIPDDFLDPIQCTLMKDPVILPSSRTTVDRAVIQRHLLSHNSDPFNRSFLTQDMLIPDIELKAKIEAFIRSHEVKKHEGELSTQTTKTTVQSRDEELRLYKTSILSKQ
ncbi:hypothetical protein GIB67_035263 [Kingdonia uniflora]|uniref:RING-type E3 ubiquitin transferase n=1 Tax=Kingdonia uniflora TaxID=39325 RepID=A0A7J7KY08_9MAGN|nr:hypothetical protein GIB67_035263 [Kingdonia uniflora]